MALVKVCASVVEVLFKAHFAPSPVAAGPLLQGVHEAPFFNPAPPPAHLVMSWNELAKQRQPAQTRSVICIRCIVARALWTRLPPRHYQPPNGCSYLYTGAVRKAFILDDCPQLPNGNANSFRYAISKGHSPPPASIPGKHQEQRHQATSAQHELSCTGRCKTTPNLNNPVRNGIGPSGEYRFSVWESERVQFDHRFICFALRHHHRRNLSQPRPGQLGWSPPDRVLCHP